MGADLATGMAVVLDQALAPLLSTLGSGPAEVRQLSLGYGCVWGTLASLFRARSGWWTMTPTRQRLSEPSTAAAAKSGASLQVRQYA